MKKLIAISIVVCMALGISAISHADGLSTQKDITVSLPVDSQFGMEIWDAEFTQMLDNVLPGGGDTGDIHIYATSNHSIPWTVNARCAGLVGEYQPVPDTLPVAISTYDGGAGLTGTVVADLTLTAADQAIYVSGAGESPCSGLQVNAIFAVNSETSTKQDLYSGTLVLTMTE